MDEVTTAETLTKPARPGADSGDHDRVAHYVRAADATRAYITGEAIEALCGKWWVPTRDPDLYPICGACQALKEAGFRFPPGGGV